MVICVRIRSSREARTTNHRIFSLCTLCQFLSVVTVRSLSRYSAISQARYTDSTSDRKTQKSTPERRTSKHATHRCSASCLPRENLQKSKEIGFNSPPRQRRVYARGLIICSHLQNPEASEGDIDRRDIFCQVHGAFPKLEAACREKHKKINSEHIHSKESIDP